MQNSNSNIIAQCEYVSTHNLADSCFRKVFPQILSNSSIASSSTSHPSTCPSSTCRSSTSPSSILRATSHRSISPSNILPSTFHSCTYLWSTSPSSKLHFESWSLILKLNTKQRRFEFQTIAYAAPTHTTSMVKVVYIPNAVFQFKYNCPMRICFHT